MNIELRDIDEQIRKLQELRKLVADPDMIALLNQLISVKNGHSTGIVLSSTVGKENTKKKGRFIEKIEETCRNFGTSSFTINDVIKAFEQRGNVFGANNKSVATYSAMRRLQKRRVVEVVQQGVGSAPSTYRVVQ